MNTQRTSRRLIIIWLATAAFALPATAWPWGETVRGNGIVKQEARAPGSFHGVALGIPAQVEVRMGNAENVTVETDENLPKELIRLLNKFLKHTTRLISSSIILVVPKRKVVGLLC